LKKEENDQQAKIMNEEGEVINNE